MKAKHVRSKFPAFAEQFDGSATECCLTFYYKKVRIRDDYGNEDVVYEFIDDEARDEVAELMGANAIENLRLAVPFREAPMKMKHIRRKFPAFAAQFDGPTTEANLALYYKKARTRDNYGNEDVIYEFIDDKAEDKVAELMGVKVGETELLDEDSTESAATKALNAAQIEEFQEHVADIRENIRKSDAGRPAAAPDYEK